MNEVSTMAASDTENPQDFEHLPPVECTPWCEDGTGHTDAWDPEDQWCHGTPRRVRLTRMPLRTSQRTQWLDSLKFYLAREREGQPYLHLGRDDLKGVTMTLVEVREMRDHLTELLAKAGADQ
jgi:hypothetical protein